MAKKAEKKEFSKEELENLLGKFAEVVEKAVKKEEEDHFDDEEKEQIIKNVNEIATECKKAIICAGDDHTFIAGTGRDAFNLLGNIIRGLAKNGLPKEDVQMLIEVVYDMLEEE